VRGCDGKVGADGPLTLSGNRRGWIRRQQWGAPGRERGWWQRRLPCGSNPLWQYTTDSPPKKGKERAWQNRRQSLFKPLSNDLLRPHARVALLLESILEKHSLIQDFSCVLC
jgi:hypothetical protein